MTSTLTTPNFTTAEIDAQLAAHLPNIQSRLVDAMRYSVMAGGKRIRPQLVLAACQCFDGDIKNAMHAACAVEYIHTYSLIHDDLPAMDNDDLRRGKPTCHKAFDDATAILAGDALQAVAFDVIAHSPLPPTTVTRMIQTLARAISVNGMAGGQMLDLLAENKICSIEEIENIHNEKTGALLSASILLGALSANMTDEITLTHLKNFGNAIGLAFQIQDDILDVTETSDTLGKPANSDVILKKSTYVSVAGLNNARSRVADLHKQALAALTNINGHTEPLKALADIIVKRHH